MRRLVHVTIPLHVERFRVLSRRLFSPRFELQPRFRRFRLVNRLYAFFVGYFWLPCPRCGKYYGGHEHGGMNWLGDGRGTMTCYRCPGEQGDPGPVPMLTLDLRTGKSSWN